MRENSERPSTIQVGTNVLIGSDLERLRVELENISSGKFKKGLVPALWDGMAAERITTDIESFFS
jgi:UDP-N-acetylglucosamine 2-epimerase (non-hydrolysing)